MEINPREFGSLEEQVRSLRRDVDHLAENVERLLQLAERGKGAWWAAMTISAGLGSVLSYLVSHFWPK